MDKELKVKIVADTKSLQTELKQAENKVKNFANASENSTSALDKLKSVIQEQKTKLAQLKSEYADVILRQKEQGKTTTDLATKMKLLNDSIKNNQSQLDTALNASNSFTDALDGSEGMNNTNASTQELVDTLQQIRGLSIADLFLENYESVSKAVGNIKKDLQLTKSAFNNAKEEIGSLFSKEYWDGASEGAETFREKLGVVKTQAGEAFKSVKSGLASLKPAFAAMGKVILASFVVTLAAAVMQVRNAIRAAERMKTAFFEAQKVGLSTAEYQKWGYVLQSVGVEADSLSDFIKTLSDEQATLREGSEGISKALEQLGMDIDDVVNMSQEELFTQTVTRLQQVENQVDRTALAYQIFGEDAAQLANIINMSNGSIQSLMRNYQLLGGEASDTLVNKSLQLQQAISNMKVAWQGLGNTLAEWIMPVITNVIRWLTVAIAKINMFIRAVLGYEIVSTGSSSATKKAAGGVSSYANAVNGATKAVEKLKRVTMGFDELNIIPNTQDSGSSGSGSFGGGDIGASMGGIGAEAILNEEDVENLEKFKKKMEEIKEFLQGFIPIALTAIGIVGCVACLFTSNWVGAVAFGAMAGVGIQIGMENGAWAQMAEGIKNIWNNIKEWFKEYVAPVFTKEFWSEKWEKVKKACLEKLVEITIGIIAKVLEVQSWWDTNVAPIFTKQYWKDIFDKVKQGIKEKLDEIKTTFTEKWNGVKSWYNTNIAPKFTKEYWKGVFNKVKEAAATKLEEVRSTISTKWNSVKSWFSTNVAPKFTATYWKNKFGSIKDGAKHAFNGVIEAVERAINTIVSRINELSWQVPDWVPAIGGQRWGFNFGQVSIPRLAQGGITNGSTLANIGEGGYREAILPLERNTEWMDTLADKIAARQTGTPTILTVDGKVFAQTAVDSINSLTKQTGNLGLVLI